MRIARTIFMVMCLGVPLGERRPTATGAQPPDPNPGNPAVVGFRAQFTVALTSEDVGLSVPRVFTAATEK